MNWMILKGLNKIYGLIISVFIVGAAAYAGYALWDNAQIYQQAKDVQDQIRHLKPKDKGPSFDELRAINPDVVAWLDVKGTNIDNPVLQGKTNLTYMDKDVYGNFSLAGSLFLDTRNKADFSDHYSLIYGHNMDEHLMFGDLDLFKDKDFFKKHRKATLLIPGEKREFSVAAVLQTSAGNEEIFNPDRWKGNMGTLGNFLQANSKWYHAGYVQALIDHPDEMEVLSLATCSDGSTNDRTILILMRTKNNQPIKDEGIKSNNTIIGHGSKKTGDTQNPQFWMRMIVGIILFIVVFEGIDRLRSRKKI
ncbi:MAG: class B sortase [Sharpea porci]|uniref:class B sortase n=1 Tax=Sharpea porci TaxID=2652286 RepID=UPI002409F614|nr:class B sortase [Sharpea porci]MDD6711856.1 class B sortase [Sharpea porci]